MTPDIKEIVKSLRGWAKAYRDTPEHRFPSDPNAEFFPVDLDAAADALQRSSERIAVVQGDLDRESKEAESYHAFWIEERSKRIAAEAAVKAERERCAKIAEDQAIAFLSPEYASEQPLGSFCERFACERVAEAIRASVSGSTEGGK